MLEKLSVIDWNGLGFPELPDLIRGMASGDEELRERAYDEFYDHNWAGLTRAAPYIVTFLIELLSQEDVQHKVGLLLILMQIASDATVYTSELARDTLNEISQGIDIFIPFLNNLETAYCATELIGYLPSRAHKSIPKLKSLVDTDTPAKLKAIAIQSISDLVANGEMSLPEEREEYRTYIENIMSSANTGVIQTTAAIALTDLMKSASPDEAKNIIVEAIIDSVSSGNWGVGELCRKLANLDIERAINALLEVLPYMHDVRDVFKIVPIALNLAFNDGEIMRCVLSYYLVGNHITEIRFTVSHDNTPTQAASERGLNPLQLQVLTALVDNDLVWVVQSNIFSLYRLPKWRDELRQLISLAQ